VSELGFLGFEVACVVLVGFLFDGDLLDDFEVMAFESDDFSGVVGHEADFADAEVGDDLGADAVVAEVHGEAEFKVGFDGIETLLLEFVGFDFAVEADATTFVAAHVDDDAGSFLFDALHGGVELAAAVAAAGGEDVASEALAVDAHEGGGVGLDLAFDEGDVVGAVENAAIKVEAEAAVIGGHVDFLHFLDESFAAPAVGNEVGDAAHAEAVLLGEGAEVIEAGHGAVGIHDFDEDAGGGEAGEAGEIGGGFGVACAAEDATGFGDEGVDVTGLDEILRDGARVGEELDGAGAVGGADAGGDAFGGVDGNGEVGAEGLAILRDHAFKVELAGDLEGDSDAEHAAAFADHEIDHLGGDFFGGADEVALILTIFVIRDDDHFSGSNVRDDGVDGIEGGFGGGRHGRWVKSRTTRRVLRRGVAMGCIQ
jgi:hypothetical protein